MDQVEVHEKLNRLVSGDRQCESWFYDSFGPRLYRRLQQRYGYPGGLEADDLLHDSVLFFFRNDYKILRDFLSRHRADAQTPEALDRHLWDLACGLASNRLRVAPRRNVVPLIEAHDSPRAAVAEQRTVDRDTLVRLDSCLKRSGQRVYFYFKLRYYDGLSPQEITRVAGWSRKVTYKLKQSLNQALRECATELGLQVS